MDDPPHQRAARELRRGGDVPVCSDPATSTNILDATTYHDPQVGYKIDWLNGLQLTAGVNNLFDEAPPICLSCSLNGYDASTYGIANRRPHLPRRT